MTYALLNAVFVAVVAAVAVVLARRSGAGRRWWLAVSVVFLVLAVLTVVFDSLMIWADLFRFDDDLLTGLRLGLAPVEDLAWPLASALLLPALWTWLGRRGERATTHETGGRHLAEPGLGDDRDDVTTRETP